MPTAQQMPNELGQNAAQYRIGSPRSVPDLEIGPAMVPNVDEEEDFPEPTTHHANTRLTDGRPALLVDQGPVGKLRGDTWTKSVTMAAAKAITNHHTPKGTGHSTLKVLADVPSSAGVTVLSRLLCAM